MARHEPARRREEDGTEGDEEMRREEDADRFRACTPGSIRKKLLIIFPLACRFSLDIVAA